MDLLGKKILNIIEQKRPELKDWCESKRHDLKGRDRVGILRFLAFSLDEKNQKLIADELGFSIADLQGMGKVLQKV